MPVSCHQSSYETEVRGTCSVQYDYEYSTVSGRTHTRIQTRTRPASCTATRMTPLHVDDRGSRTRLVLLQQDFPRGSTSFSYQADLSAPSSVFTPQHESRPSPRKCRRHQPDGTLVRFFGRSARFPPDPTKHRISSHPCRSRPLTLFTPSSPSPTCSIQPPPRRGTRRATKSDHDSLIAVQAQGASLIYPPSPSTCPSLHASSPRRPQPAADSTRSHTSAKNSADMVKETKFYEVLGVCVLAAWPARG